MCRFVLFVVEKQSDFDGDLEKFEEFLADKFGQMFVPIWQMM